jgi:inhibitor of KinA
MTHEASPQNLSTPAAPRLLPLGDSAWTIEFGQTIDSAIHARVLGMAASVEEARSTDPRLAGISDVVPTFRSVTVHFDPVHCDGAALGQGLNELAINGRQVLTQGRDWWLPVCFDNDFAPDLPRLCETRGLSRQAAIELLLTTQLRVYQIGFQPGFPYMGGLPAVLQLPRQSTPRQKVPAQSVALAGEMCGVYPWESPGGWNLVGRTSVVMFDLRQVHQPAMLVAGDKVRWYSVNRTRHEALCRQVAQGLPRETFLQAPAS